MGAPWTPGRYTRGLREEMHGQEEDDGVYRKKRGRPQEQRYGYGMKKVYIVCLELICYVDNSIKYIEGVVQIPTNEDKIPGLSEK